jgi:hypothetical protein
VTEPRAGQSVLARPAVARRVKVGWALIVVISVLTAGVGGWMAGLGGAFPSDPAPGISVAQLDAGEPFAWYFWPGVALGLVGVTLFVAALATYRRMHRERSRLVFSVPPGWPPAPPNFTPAPGWEPLDTWPAAPSGWRYWRWPSRHRSWFIRPPR